MTPTPETSAAPLVARGLDLDSETSEVPRFWRCMCCRFATAVERDIHNHLDETGHGFVSDNAYADLWSALETAQQSEGVEPFAEWHEDDGAVLWWRFPVTEAPHCGDPLCDGWPFTEDDEPHLWWTRIHGNAVQNAIAARRAAPTPERDHAE